MEEKIIQVEAEMPELQEVRPQSSEVVETETEAMDARTIAHRSSLEKKQQHLREKTSLQPA